MMRVKQFMRNGVRCPGVGKEILVAVKLHRSYKSDGNDMRSEYSSVSCSRCPLSNTPDSVGLFWYSKPTLKYYEHEFERE